MESLRNRPKRHNWSQAPPPTYNPFCGTNPFLMLHHTKRSPPQRMNEPSRCRGGPRPSDRTTAPRSSTMCWNGFRIQETGVSELPLKVVGLLTPSSSGRAVGGLLLVGRLLHNQGIRSPIYGDPDFESSFRAGKLLAPEKGSKSGP
jgi:hypothetical protein